MWVWLSLELIPLDWPVLEPQDWPSVVEPFSEKPELCPTVPLVLEPEAEFQFVPALDESETFCDVDDEKPSETEVEEPTDWLKVSDMDWPEEVDCVSVEPTVSPAATDWDAPVVSP